MMPNNNNTTVWANTWTTMHTPRMASLLACVKTLKTWRGAVSTTYCNEHITDATTGMPMIVE